MEAHTGTLPSPPEAWTPQPDLSVPPPPPGPVRRRRPKSRPLPEHPAIHIALRAASDRGHRAASSATATRGHVRPSPMVTGAIKQVKPTKAALPLGVVLSPRHIDEWCRRRCSRHTDGETRPGQMRHFRRLPHGGFFTSTKVRQPAGSHPGPQVRVRPDLCLGPITACSAWARTAPPRPGGVDQRDLRPDDGPWATWSAPG